MKDQVNLADTRHNMLKENLVTLKGGYDILKCSKCGAKGKRYGVSEYLTVNGVERLMKEAGCVKTFKRTKWPLPKEAGADLGRIQVTYCTAQGAPFDNLTPGSEHNIINPVDKNPNNANWERGVWVQGVGEPVMLLLSEFKQIK